MSRIAPLLRAAEQAAYHADAAHNDAEALRELWLRAEERAEATHRAASAAHRLYMTTTDDRAFDRCAWCNKHMPPTAHYDHPRAASGTCSLSCHEQEVDA